MYRHPAESIKESLEKQFISQADKEIYESYDITKQRKDDTYSKTEIVEVIESVSDRTATKSTGVVINETDTIHGNIVDIEVFGQTVQKKNNLIDIRSVGNKRSDGMYDIFLQTIGQNLINPNTVKLGYRFSGNGNGQIITDDQYSLTDFIHIIPGQVYTKTSTGASVMGIYNSNKQFIRLHTHDIFTALEGDCYLRATVKNDCLNTSGIINIGDTTHFEKFAGESISHIVIPCQLESIAEYKDRLFKNRDGVWCIEKFIKEKTFTGKYETWSLYPNSKQSQFTTPRLDMESNILVICNRAEAYTVSVNKDYSCYVGAQNFNMLMPSSMSLDDFKKYIQMNNITVKYVSLEPEIIVLPEDTQIILESFVGKTIVKSINTTVQPTISCIIPKSLGDTVNSIYELNNDTRNLLNGIESVENINNSKYYTETGYLNEVRSNGGRLKNVHIKGKSKVSLIDIKNYEVHSSGMVLTEIPNGFKVVAEPGRHREIRYKYQGKPQTIYTIVSRFNKYHGADNVPQIGFRNYSDGQLRANAEFKTNGKLEKNRFITDLTGEIWLKVFFQIDKEIESEIDFTDLMVIEGDYVEDSSLELFDGVCSVGTGLTPLSIEVFNGNLFDIHTVDKSNVTVEDDVISGSAVNVSRSFCIEYLEKYRHVTLSFETKASGGYIFPIITYTDGTSDTTYTTNEYLNEFVKFTVKSDIKKVVSNIRFSYNTGAANIVLRNVNVNIGDKPLQYNGTKHSVVTNILYKDKSGELVPVEELHSIPSGIYDSIEKHDDGKYYYHKRCKRVVLDGSSDKRYYVAAQTSDTTAYFGVHVKDLMSGWSHSDTNNPMGLADRLQFTNGSSIYYTEKEGITTDAEKIVMRVNRNRLSSVDIEGVQDFLQNNNINVIVPLSTEEVYECSNVDTTTEPNTSSIYINCGKIKPELSFTVNYGINNLLVDLQDDVSHMTNRLTELEDMVNITENITNGVCKIKHTKRGKVNDIYMEGETLCNYLEPIQDHSLIKVGSNAPTLAYVYRELTKPLEEGKVYTYVLLNVPSSVRLVYLGTDNSKAVAIEYTEKKYMIPFTCNRDVANNTRPLCPHFSCSTDVNLDDFKSLQLLILEGDQTGRHINQFSGIQSPGESNNGIKIITREDSQNLLNCGFESGGLLASNGNIVAAPTRVRTSNFIPIKGGKNYNITCEDNKMIAYYMLYDVNKTLLRYAHTDSSNINIETSYNSVYCKFVISHIDKSLPIGENDVDHRYVTVSEHPCKKDKINLQYIDTNGDVQPVILRGIINEHENYTVKDYIKKHSNGKYYYHKYCDIQHVNGTESVSGEVSFPSDTIKRYRMALPKLHKKNNSTLSSNVYNTKINVASVYNDTDVFIATNLGYAVFSVKSEDAPNVESFKTYLRTRNVVLVYELINPEVYELVNQNIDTFEGDTTVIVDSGPLSSNMQVTISSNIYTYMEITENRVKLLETLLYDDMVKQNRMQFNTTYRSDKVSFKVDVNASYNGKIMQTDNDIFDLLVDIINFDSNSYTISQLEEFVDFYTMLGKFTYDMAGYLFDIISEKMLD